MDGFSFPPPPPPPPKATSSSQQNPPVQNNNRGGRGGRGGNRGSFRGRGGGQQRGGRPPPHQQSYQNNDNGNYGQTQGNYHQQQQNYNNFAHQFQQQYSVPPPGAYVNPNFGGSQSHAPVPQYGQTSYTPGQPGQSFQNTAGGGAANSWSGQKRSREQDLGQTHKHPMKKPQSAPKPSVAPAVPSFGAPIPLPAEPTSSSVQSHVGSKPRPQASLGLIPQEYGAGESSDEEEEEDDVDEEAALGVSLQTGPLTFEVNGEIATLKTPAEIAEWLEERKKLWPSKRRVQEKDGEVRMRMEERRRIEEETRAAIAAASGGEYHPVVRKDVRPRQRTEQQNTAPSEQEQHGVEERPSSSLDETRKELEFQMKKVEELRKKLAESEKKADDNSKTTILDDQEQKITALEYATEEVTEQPTIAALPTEQPSTADLSNPHPEQQTLPPSLSHADNDGASDTDSGPEETTSKPSHPIRVPPPPSSQSQQSSRHQKPFEQKQCISFVNQGRCKFGDKCRYKHDNNGNGNGHGISGGAGGGPSSSKRKTLFQRLVQQEIDEENKLALKVIRYLGGIGFFSKVGGVAVPAAVPAAAPAPGS